MTARGLTWDHPRGYDALAAAAAGGGIVRWEKQPLEGFESHPIGALAARYDLLVLDHPHLGEAVALGCLTPLDDLFEPAELAAFGAATIGQAMASYRWQGRHWALPLDVATQVSAGLPEQIAGRTETWEDVVRMAERKRVALSIAGPHAVLSFFSLALAFGGQPGGDDFLDITTAVVVLDILRRLAARAPAGSETLNPIGLLETMTANGGIDFVPLVYGYVTYATQGMRQPLQFGEAPAGPAGWRGSVLGGTGIAVTRRTRPNAALLGHLRWLMSPAAQIGFIPSHNGQPASRAAWKDPEVNVAAGGFYGGTLATIEAAWIRPRFDGYIAFQTESAAIVRCALADARPAAAVLEDLRRAWTAARAVARGPLF